ncbi:anhydro-N-acetylmuramic acid kinase [Nonomuraea sediminis]|uniref:anhydro-N-acetylmuramic acid kinase n=1 Tax=Nonomuraea sediminis TaxID=2835864 RepID=UPI001BDD3088|nr:anhydro-N-acetylmuramic acid kinase [Nonomuraea sediminis]
MRVLGLISGTSHDGIDSAVVDWSLDRDGLLTGVITHVGERPYPPELRTRIKDALPPAKVDMAEVCALDTLIGQAFADVAASVRADLVCSHGQTLYHWVEGGVVRGTLQLGQPAWIAERTGLPVVSDLRARDVAAGGQGAPLVSYLDLLLLAGVEGRSGALNLGGIANLTVREPAIAYDTGPACALIDAAAPPYDRDGKLGAAGKVDEELLRELLQEPYYALEPPKTTGKELFTPSYVTSGLPQADLVATLTALTAETVAAEVRRHRLDTLVVSGGGVRNPTLMRMLRERVTAKVVPSDELGVPSDAKEAIAFSLFGWLTAHGLPATVPSCTGASGARVLGTITPGARPLELSPSLTEVLAARFELRTQ